MEPMCFQIIKDRWEEENDINVSQKVKKCAESLEVWGREITGCFGRRIKECKIKLKELCQKRYPQSISEFESTKEKLHLIYGCKQATRIQNTFMLPVIKENETITYRG